MKREEQQAPGDSKVSRNWMQVVLPTLDPEAREEHAQHQAEWQQQREERTRQAEEIVQGRGVPSARAPFFLARRLALFRNLPRGPGEREEALRAQERQLWRGIPLDQPMQQLQEEVEERLNAVRAIWEPQPQRQGPERPPRLDLEGALIGPAAQLEGRGAAAVPQPPADAPEQPMAHAVPPPPLRQDGETR